METLRGLRLQSGKTVAEVAKALEIAPSSYYNYEQGTRQINIAQVVVLAECFGVLEREVIEAQINTLNAREDSRN